MPRTAKKQVTSSDGAQSVPTQTELSAKDTNKRSAPAPVEDEDINTETAPVQLPEESSTPEQTSADEDFQTIPGKQKQTQTFQDIQKRLEVTSADLNLT